MYSFLPFEEVDDEHREVLEKERGPLELEQQDVLVGLLIAYLACSIKFCRSYDGVMGHAITEDVDLGTKKKKKKSAPLQYRMCPESRSRWLFVLKPRNLRGCLKFLKFFRKNFFWPIGRNFGLQRVQKY